MIPAGMLQEVWNRLVDQHVNTALPEAGLAIRGFLLLCCSRTKSEFDIDSLIDRIRAQESDQKRGGPPPRPLDMGEFTRLQIAIVWPPWNAVEGPANRADDPSRDRPSTLGRGEFRDKDFDRFTIGLTPQDAARTAMIDMLFREFKCFLSTQPGAESLGALAKAAARARSVLARDAPIPFDPKMWIKDAGGWRKRQVRDGVST
jgi:hypothetical protein